MKRVMGTPPLEPDGVQVRCTQLEVQLREAQAEVTRLKQELKAATAGKGQSPATHKPICDVLELAKVMEDSPLPFFMKDRLGIYLTANLAWRKQLSPPGTEDPVEVVGKSDRELVTADLAEHLRTQDEQVLSTGTLLTVLHSLPFVVGKKAKLQTMHKYRVFTSLGEPQIVGVLQDGSSERKAVVALRTTQEQFRQLTQRIEQGYWVANLTGQSFSENGGGPVRKVWGFTDGESIGISSLVPAEIHPEDELHVRHAFQAWILGDQPSFEVEYRILKPDGTIRWLEDRATKIVYAAGDPAQATGVIRDVTSRKQAELALRESEARYRLLAENSTDLITRHSIVNGIKYASPACLQLLGFPPEDLVGKSAFELIHPEDVNRLHEMRFNLLSGAQLAPVTYRFRRKDGTYIWLEVRGRAIVDAETGEVREVVAISRDVTERIASAQQLREREVELAHAERLSAMGQMAAQLAHEINQPLFAIANYAEACQSVLQQKGVLFDDDLSLWIDHIAEQSRRVGQIIRRVQQLSRTGDINFAEFDVNESIQRLLPMFYLEQQNIDSSVEAELVDGLPLVLADRILIEQVIVNLIRNALDAMRDLPYSDRRLTIRTRMQGRDCVVVDVIDRGSGIADGDQYRIFEPYYSTKAQGLGLGLAICKTILNAHEGEITCENNPDGGTTFSVFLPIHTEE